MGHAYTIIRADGSSKHFTYLSEILHMVDRQDVIHLYGMVTEHFKTHESKGFGLFLLGDLHVLNDSSYASGKGFHVWGDKRSRKIVN